MDYDSVNLKVLELMPRRASRVLDVGCGCGSLGAAIARAHGSEVVGITKSPTEAAAAESRLSRVILADIDEVDPAAIGIFDCIVLSHVLEHLPEPAAAVRRLLGCLASEGALVVALPNALFWRQRIEFMRGRFRYTEGGIMDRGHFRFFDWVAARQMLEEAGLAVEEAAADGGLPLSRLLPRTVGSTLNRWALSAQPGLWGWQFVFRCRVQEGSAVRDVLTSAGSVPTSV